MWLSRQTAGNRRTAAADRGRVTIGGMTPAVYSGAERRNLPLFGPGGYYWRPEQGDSVLILKTGEEGEAPCVLGREAAGEVAAGEILIANGRGASIRLGADGSIRLTGALYLNGAPFPPTEEA